MRRGFARVLAVIVMTLLAVASVLATCGGGGGGGTGGMSGLSGAGEVEVYPVPWRIAKAEDTLAAGSLVVYWFPSSQVEFDKSSLRNSRMLSLYASQCVTMDVADGRSPLGQTLAADEKLPVVVLAPLLTGFRHFRRSAESFLCPLDCAPHGPCEYTGQLGMEFLW